MARESRSERWEVVIVGAGPVGLSLALALARRGREVLVLEKEEGTAEHSRAPAIWPGTQEILAELGVIDAFREEGVELDRVELLDVDSDSVLLSIPLRELEDETRFPRLLILPQSRTEARLLTALRAESSAEVRFGCEVTGVVESGRSAPRGPSSAEGVVEVTYRTGVAEGPEAADLPTGPTTERVVRARIAVGCDGAHSRVRESLGADFQGATYAMRAALADLKIEDASDLRFPRLTTRAGVGIGIRISPEVWRLILPFAEDDRTPLDERVSNVATALFGRDYPRIWISEFRLHRRVSTRFQGGRVVLAGDAAHLNSPVGGQGMNAGIRDASLLAPAIVRDLEEGGTDALSAYARTRRDEIREGVNRFTNLLTRILLAGGGRGRLLRPTLRVANVVLKIGPVRRRFLRRLAMLE